jgi:ribose transport system permease protein
MKKAADLLRNWAPLIGLVLVTGFFAFATKGALLSSTNLQSLLNQFIVTAIIAIGAVFVFGSGNFDMSMGSLIALCAVLGGMVAIATGSLVLAFLTIMGASLVFGVLKGLFASYVEVPLFIVTLVLSFVIGAGLLVIMGTETTIFLTSARPPIPAFTEFQMTVTNLVTLGGFFLLCVVLFNFTGLGREVRILGGNPTTARQSGMSIPKVKMMAFLVGAIGVGLAAFLLLVRTRTVGYMTAVSTGTDVLVALVLGGMPLSGGPRSRISAGLVGAVTITVLNSGLTIMGLDLATIQISRAVIFLAVVYVASMTYRTKLLPR